MDAHQDFRNGMQSWHIVMAIMPGLALRLLGCNGY